MKILFYIESLRSGGKERRLVELIKGLSVNTEFHIELVLTKKEIHYKDIFKTSANISYTIRRGLKKDPRVFYKFYKICKRNKPDIIHVWGNLVAIYAIPTKVFLNIPVINSQIADAPLKVNNSILSHRVTFPFSNVILANSHAGLTAYKAPESKSAVIYNGFDFNRIKGIDNTHLIRKKFAIKTKYIVGMVASFSDKKDYTTYLLAANDILSHNYDVTFLCIGAGETLNYKSIVKPSFVKNILFLGKQDNVESIMNLCDIGVLATYTEGISNALLEFMALGKPVIATLGGGTNELVANNESGYLVKPKSPHELAQKIKILLDDDNRRNQFGVKGRERIIKKFSIEKMISDFEKVYKKLGNKD